MYTIKAQLGKGSFGEVFLVQNKITQELAAMKILDKTKLESNFFFFIKKSLLSFFLYNKLQK